MTRAKRLEALAWVLLYGGLLAGIVGLFAVRQSSGGTGVLGVAMIVVGLGAVVAGIVLIAMRARMGGDT